MKVINKFKFDPEQVPSNKGKLHKLNFANAQLDPALDKLNKLLSHNKLTKSKIFQIKQDSIKNMYFSFKFKGLC